ncbi:hypothetical protein LTR70_005624 [Exophiala xenobiotica]|uniref:Uncharacterized protein n=1 Tax=Lithohypha guttulata TaxID=1690604 RepID=A0ABR0JYR2_9EURO|nr:hypothetical protein LTR24_008827 [Lithohypha guttulata]KAK5317944.1 hypothetical protein LTR70_005624 [Exophiala xenobiotica]
MCYPALVVQERCDRGHPQEIRLCWRQCRARSVGSYQTGQWNNLCTVGYSYPDIQIYSPTATVATDCATCYEVAEGVATQAVQTKLRALKEVYNNTEHAIKGFGEELSEVRYRIRNEHLNQYGLAVLRSTEKDLDGRINILHLVQGKREPAIKKCNEELEEMEDYLDSQKRDDAVDNAVSHVGPRLIYFGSLPEEDEKQARSALGDWPRYIAPEGPDVPMDQWGVYQEVEEDEELEEDEEMME